MNTTDELSWLGPRPVGVRPRPARAPAEVEVLALRGPLDAARRARLAALLSEDERARAARYVRARSRDLFLLSRGGLRSVLGARLGRDPASLRFDYGPAGRPRLSEPGAPHFNVSHSGALVLVALSRAGDVGVDVERISDAIGCEGLADRFFSTEEARGVRAVRDPRERRLAFFRCWTRKEAYLKVKGAGLTVALSRFRVSLLVDEPPALLATAIDGDRPEDWTVHDLDVSDGYVGALVRRVPGG